MAQTAGSKPQAIRLIDNQLSLSSTLNDQTSQSFIGAETGDKIILNCNRLNKNGNISISVKDYNRGNEIYKWDGFDMIRDQEIVIPAKGIYIVSLRTASLLSKDVKLTVDRIPSENATAGMTDHKQQFDTTSVEVINTTSRAYSKNSPQANNMVLKIDLPPNTTYWVYWIGAGKDAKEKMRSFVASCSTIGALFPSNPLVLYGKKIMSTLPMSSSNALISYHFIDTRNTAAFKGKQQFSSYMFKSAEKISTEYASIHNNQQDLNLAIANESMGTDQDVEVRVVAFIVKPRP